MWLRWVSCRLFSVLCFRLDMGISAWSSTGNFSLSMFNSCCSTAKALTLTGPYRLGGVGEICATIQICNLKIRYCTKGHISWGNTVFCWANYETSPTMKIRLTDQNGYGKLKARRIDLNRIGWLFSLCFEGWGSRQLFWTHSIFQQGLFGSMAQRYHHSFGRLDQGIFLALSTRINGHRPRLFFHISGQIVACSINFIYQYDPFAQMN